MLPIYDKNLQYKFFISLKDYHISLHLITSLFTLKWHLFDSVFQEFTSSVTNNVTSKIQKERKSLWIIDLLLIKPPILCLNTSTSCMENG